MRDDKPRKQKKTTQQKRDEKFYSRAKSEKLLAQGADPTTVFRDEKGTERGRYTQHSNYHVRALAWKKMGKPLPDDAEERSKFLASIKVKEKPVEDVVEPAPEAFSTEVVPATETV